MPPGERDTLREWLLRYTDEWLRKLQEGVQSEMILTTELELAGKNREIFAMVH